MSKMRKQRGFNIIELMMSILVAGILLAIAVPSFQQLTLRSQQTNHINSFAAMIARARAEAVSRNRNVVICVSSDQATCAGTATWESGWILFVDRDLDSSYSAGDDLLKVGDKLPSGVTVRSSGFASDRMIFTKGTGLMSGNQAGTFRFCDSRGLAALAALNVSIAGQVRIARDSNNDGHIEDYAGAELTSCP